MKGGTVITLASRPLNDASLDMGLPPYARRLDVRATRAAFAAGTLGTVGDDVAREDGERYVVLRDANRNDANDVKHGLALAQNPAPGAHTFVPMAGPGSEGGRRCAVCCHVHGSYARALPVTTHDFTERGALRQSRLRRWQTPR